MKEGLKLARLLFSAVFAFLAFSGTCALAQYQWSNFAGMPGGYGNVDGTGSSARFNSPFGVAVDPSGNVYVADTYNHTIRKVTPGGVVTTLAGLAGTIGSSDGTGSAARFNYPQSVAVDASGNVYVADQSNHTLRKITSAGAVTTLAGSAGASGSSNGTGSAARFNLPAGVAVDASGNVYVGDTGNSTIRKVTSAGVVTTLAGTAGSSGSTNGTGSAARFSNPNGVAVDTAGNVYVADAGNHIIRKVTSAGVVTTLAGLAGTGGSSDGTSAARFFAPYGVAVDAAGNVYVGDTGNHTLRKVTSAGVVSTLAGLAGSYGSSNGTGSAAQFYGPKGVAVDSSGNIFVADSANSAIRKVNSVAVVITLAGSVGFQGSSDGLGSAARFNLPTGVAVDSSGNVYVGDSGNSTIRKVTSAGGVSTLAGSPGSTGSNDDLGSYAQFNFPHGLAVDASGNVYVADQGNHTIRKITPDGLVSTLAGLAGSSGSSDGTGSAARFNNPMGVAVDASGNVYVADFSNHTIRKITSGGVVSTLAGLAGSSGSASGTGSTARFNSPQGVAIDSNGIVYVADTANHTLRKVTSAGLVTTLAGLAGTSGSSDGTTSAARFANPDGVAVDSAGNVYVADRDNHTIRKVTSGGVVTTIGGTAGVIDGKDGAGAAASFASPKGIAVTSAGTIFVVDENNRISLGTIGLVAHDIAVQQPAGTSVPFGGTQTFGTLVQGGTTSLTFTITNPGTEDLTGLAITIDGTNAADFSVTASPVAPVTFGGSTTFTVQFAPPAGGALTLIETATLRIASNAAGKNPYVINLTGVALSYTQSTFNDGMSDAAKFLLAPLGFNWQLSQSALVNTYYSNANAANLYTQAQYNANRTAGRNDVTSSPNTYSLYTLSQVQTLNVGTPLLTKNQGTGQFKLTIGVQQTPDLSQSFTAFPLNAPNSSINAQGQLEFLFTAPGSAAFFRVQAK